MAAIPDGGLAFVIRAPRYGHLEESFLRGAARPRRAADLDVRPPRATQPTRPSILSAVDRETVHRWVQAKSSVLEDESGASLAPICCHAAIAGYASLRGVSASPIGAQRFPQIVHARAAGREIPRRSSRA
jgi:hypothetical protein